MGRTKISKNNFFGNELDGDFRVLWWQYFFTKWDGNYYDSWTGSGSFIIHGEIFREEWYGGDIIWEFEWRYLDKEPVKEPYDVTTVYGCGIR
jgi:hypothetical protein